MTRAHGNALVAQCLTHFLCAVPLDNGAGLETPVQQLRHIRALVGRSAANMESGVVVGEVSQPPAIGMVVGAPATTKETLQ